MEKQVLVVDDHPPTVKLLEDVLAKEGHSVATATDGVECLRLVENSRPDLLIMDLLMPTLNGLDTLRLLREQFDGRQLPVIILSGRGDWEHVRSGYQLGADIYLTKPVRVGAVVAAVNWLLRETDGVAPQDEAPARPEPAASGLMAQLVTSDLAEGDG